MLNRPPQPQLSSRATHSLSTARVVAIASILLHTNAWSSTCVTELDSLSSLRQEVKTIHAFAEDVLKNTVGNRLKACALQAKIDPKQIFSDFDRLMSGKLKIPAVTVTQVESAAEASCSYLNEIILPIVYKGNNADCSDPKLLTGVYIHEYAHAYFSENLDLKPSFRTFFSDLKRMLALENKSDRSKEETETLHRLWAEFRNDVKIDPVVVSPFFRGQTGYRESASSKISIFNAHSELFADLAAAVSTDDPEIISKFVASVRSPDHQILPRRFDVDQDDRSIVPCNVDPHLCLKMSRKLVWNLYLDEKKKKNFNAGEFLRKVALAMSQSMNQQLDRPLNVPSPALPTILTTISETEIIVESPLTPAAQSTILNQSLRKVFSK